MLVRRGRLLPVLVFRGQTSCVTTAVDSTHPLLGPGSPDLTPPHPVPVTLSQSTTLSLGSISGSVF